MGVLGCKKRLGRGVEPTWNYKYSNPAVNTFGIRAAASCSDQYWRLLQVAATLFQLCCIRVDTAQDSLEFMVLGVCSSLVAGVTISWE